MWCVVCTNAEKSSNPCCWTIHLFAGKCTCRMDNVISKSWSLPVGCLQFSHELDILCEHLCHYSNEVLFVDDTCKSIPQDVKPNNAQCRAYPSDTKTSSRLHLLCSPLRSVLCWGKWWGAFQIAELHLLAFYWGILLNSSSKDASDAQLLAYSKILHLLWQLVWKAFALVLMAHLVLLSSAGRLWKLSHALFHSLAWSHSQSSAGNKGWAPRLQASDLAEGFFQWIHQKPQTFLHTMSCTNAQVLVLLF